MVSSSDRTSQNEVQPFSPHQISRRNLLAGALYLLPMNGFMHMEQEKGPTRMESITGFEPRQHGFHFRNDFVNVLFDRAGLRLTTYGRCGGMAYAALDYYFAHRPIPLYEHVPECTSNATFHGTYDAGAYHLVHYIYKRQIDSMVSIWPFGRALDFVWYTIASEREVFHWTINTELDRLTQYIQAGNPVPLGLIGVSDIRRIGENHQVVAYGYTRNQTANTIATVYVYDSNHPDQEVSLLLDTKHRCVQSSAGKTWRGFFVRDDYRPRSFSALPGGGLA